MHYHDQGFEGGASAWGGMRLQESDLVFDFSGLTIPDLGGLAFILTARQLAEKDNRRVWMRGLPESTWRLLSSLGLDHLFEFFPHSGGVRN